MMVLNIFETLISVLIFCFSFLVVSAIFSYWKVDAYNKDLKILKPPLLVFWIGLVSYIGCISGVFIIFFRCLNEETLVYAIFLFIFSILYVWFMLYSLNWRIEIKEDSLLYQNIFKKEIEIKYSDITKLKRLKIGGYRIFFGAKSISVDFFVRGQQNLWDILKLLNISNNS